MNAATIDFDNSSFIEKIASFGLEVFTSAKETFVGIARDLYQHTEAVGVLVLASLGLNSLLGELPFYFMLPMWIEASMVIPVASVFLIGLLVALSTWRAKRRSK